VGSGGGGPFGGAGGEGAGVGPGAGGKAERRFLHFLTASAASARLHFFFAARASALPKTAVAISATPRMAAVAARNLSPRDPEVVRILPIATQLRRDPGVATSRTPGRNGL